MLKLVKPRPALTALARFRSRSVPLLLLQDLSLCLRLSPLSLQAPTLKNPAPRPRPRPKLGSTLTRPTSRGDKDWSIGTKLSAVCIVFAPTSPDPSIWLTFLAVAGQVSKTVPSPCWRILWLLVAFRMSSTLLAACQLLGMTRVILPIWTPPSRMRSTCHQTLLAVLRLRRSCSLLQSGGQVPLHVFFPA